METVEEYEKKICPPVDLRCWLDAHSPHDLFSALTEKVLGQDEEIRKAAILVYSYIKAMERGQTASKFHFMIEGRSGCGKTTFANALRELLPCPVITVDASQLTPAGFKGAEAGDFISSEELEKWWGCGVIILDELDKVMEPVASDSSDNFHRQGLENLLKMLDGGTIVGRDGKSVDCERMLFIGMGAFSQLKEKQPEKRAIGFMPSVAPSEAPTDTDLSKEAMTEFCGSEQFLGRVVTVLHFKPLGRDLYRKIVEYTRHEIMRLFGDCPLSVEETERIIDEAMTSEFGCRSIRSAVWETFLGRDTVIKRTARKDYSCA